MTCAKTSRCQRQNHPMPAPRITATCATGERLCPFLGAGPYPKITPAPGGLMTCAKTSRYLRRGWQSPDPKCPHLRQNQLVPAPKCQQGAFTGNGEGATSNSDRLPPTARGDRP